MDVRNFTHLIVCVRVCVFILEFGIVTVNFVTILYLCHQDIIQIIKYIQNQVSDPSKHYFGYLSYVAAILPAILASEKNQVGGHPAKYLSRHQVLWKNSKIRL